jgi:hypothetical protein
MSKKLSPFVTVHNFDPVSDLVFWTTIRKQTDLAKRQFNGLEQTQLDENVDSGRWEVLMKAICVLMLHKLLTKPRKQNGPNFVRWSGIKEKTENPPTNQGKQGPMLWLKKRFLPQKIGENSAFLTLNKANLHKNLIITLGFNKSGNFFAENCLKSQKIVIITLTPDEFVKHRPNSCPTHFLSNFLHIFICG